MANDKAEVSAEAFAAAVFSDGQQLVVNLDAIQEAKFELLPKGTYQAEVAEASFGDSSKGSKMFTLVFQVTEGDYAGRKLYNYISLSQKALPFSKTTLLRLAPDLFSGPFKPEEIIQQGSLLGRKCTLRVKHEDYEGEPQARISAILPAQDAANGAFAAA